MGFKGLIGVWLLVLAMVSGAQSQYRQTPVPTRDVAPMPQQGGPATLPYSGIPQGYGNAAPAPGGYPAQPDQGYSDMNSPDWPSYPYPRYHNPYYEGTAARDFVSGTLDWLMCLPSNVFDRFSNFLDGHVFPQAPATHGSSGQPQTGASNGPGQGVLPSAVPSAPATR
jgi:hypothetical protein